MLILRNRAAPDSLELKASNSRKIFMKPLNFSVRYHDRLISFIAASSLLCLRRYTPAGTKTLTNFKPRPLDVSEMLRDPDQQGILSF